MGISHTLFRRFFWADSVLWKEDISKHRVSVVLAGRDIVVDTKVIRAYLTSSADLFADTAGWKDERWQSDGLDVQWFKNLDHGQVFDDKTAKSRLLEIVCRFCEQP